ncbi:MAG: hypothetical protein LBI80_02300 [Endomicrobium sp.]|jgi:Fic family protein|nr:hypothetical protein [Endomicrobium sp.]
MINKTTKDKIKELFSIYKSLSKENKNVLREIATAEIPEMVYNSNAIENSTLTLEDTEDILLQNKIKKNTSLREVFETKNLAVITENLLYEPKEELTIKFILSLHKILLTNIDDSVAGRFRSGKEWVRIGTHIEVQIQPLQIN